MNENSSKYIFVVCGVYSSEGIPAIRRRAIYIMFHFIFYNLSMKNNKVLLETNQKTTILWTYLLSKTAPKSLLEQD